MGGCKIIATVRTAQVSEFLADLNSLAWHWEQAVALLGAVRRGRGEGERAYDGYTARPTGTLIDLS